MQKTSWGPVAEWYDDLLEGGEGTYQKEVILPNLLRLVELQKDKNVLDIACGQGFFSRAFAEKGAKVTGVDISPELITYAQQHSSKDISYFVNSAEVLTDIKDASFDGSVIVLALQNIEHIQTALQEAARTLKSQGSLHIVLNHPAFRIPGRSDWSWDEKTQTQFRRIDAYMSERTNSIDMTPGEKNLTKKKYTVSFHRPLQVYFKALNKAGFTVSRLEEWISHKKSQKGPRGAEEDRIRKEIPMFLYIEAKKM